MARTCGGEGVISKVYTAVLRDPTPERDTQGSRDGHGGCVSFHRRSGFADQVMSDFPLYGEISFWFICVVLYGLDLPCLCLLLV